MGYLNQTLAVHIELWMMLVMGLLASLMTGVVVGFAVSQPLRTYQLMLVTFLSALTAWLSTALLTGGLMVVGLEWLTFQIMPLSGLAVGGLLGSMTYIWIRSQRRRSAHRWAIVGSLAAWLFVAIASGLAYHHFKTIGAPGDRDSVLPTGFWSCISYSMALSSIFGACSGGLIFHQTRHLRS